MELKVLDKKGAITESRKVLEAVFSKNYSDSLVHQLVESYRANGRGGNRAQKNRSSVKFSTRKPWKQKGTGRGEPEERLALQDPEELLSQFPLENFSKRMNKKCIRPQCNAYIPVGEGRAAVYY